jgi:hypothetical protein
MAQQPTLPEPHAPTPADALQDSLTVRTQQLLRHAVLAGTLSTSFLQHHAAAFLCTEEEPATAVVERTA